MPKGFYRLCRDKSMWAFALFWILFIYLFRQDGPLGWQEERMFDRGWWADAEKHLLAGIVGGWNIIYVIRNYALNGLFRITGHIFLLIVVIGAMMGFSFLWEQAEAWHDLTLDDICKNPTLIAQKNKLDTFIDVLLTGIIGPIVALFGYRARDVFYQKYFPEDHIKECVEELRGDLENIVDKMEEVFKKKHGAHHARPILRLIKKIGKIKIRKHPS